VAQFLHPVTEQSGSDLKPQAVDEGTFKGNTGAIGGTVTDQTGAAIAEPPLRSRPARRRGNDGQDIGQRSYLVRDLAPASTPCAWNRPDSRALCSTRFTSPGLPDRRGCGDEGGRDGRGGSGECVQVMNQTESAQVVSKGREPAEIEKRIVAGPNGRAAITESTFTPRLRHVFEETAFWAPSLETDAGGRASLHFNLPTA